MLSMSGSRAAEADLSFYFGEGERLLGGHSSMGPMLEHAALYHVPRDARTPQAAITRWHTVRRPTSDQFVPDDDALHRFGRVSRRLRDAGHVWPPAPQILAAYYGAEGDRWGRSTQGRLGSLIRFTDTGKRMIAAQRARERGAKLKVTDAQRAENAAASVIASARAELGRAMMEARALLVRAMEAYVGREIACSAAE